MLFMIVERPRTLLAASISTQFSAGGSTDNLFRWCTTIIDNAKAALDRELNGNTNANSQTLQAPENYTWFALAAWYFYQQSVLFDAGQSQNVEPNP